VEHEEAGGLYSTVGNQAEDDEDESDKEAIEAKVNWRDIHGNDKDVHQSWEDSTQSLASHHASHVVWWELPSNSNKTTLEDGGANVEEDHHDESRVQEPLLPLVRVYPGHDQDSNKESCHQRQSSNQPEIQLKSLAIEHVENYECCIGNVGGNGQVRSEFLL